MRLSNMMMAVVASGMPAKFHKGNDVGSAHVSVHLLEGRDQGEQEDGTGILFEDPETRHLGELFPLLQPLDSGVSASL